MLIINNATIAALLPTLTCLLTQVDDIKRTSDGMKSYEGYEIVSVTLDKRSSSNAYQLMESLYLQDVLYDFMTPPSYNRPIDVMLCPEQAKNFKRILTELDVPFVVKSSNVQTLIDMEKRANDVEQLRTQQMSWNAYHRLETIQNWMDSMAEKYPSIVSTEVYGKSYDGRDMKVLKISTGSLNSTSKPAVWLDAGIHAREWIAPATATYIANELINEAISEGPNYRLVDAVDWYIVPNMNPDGYEFSHTDDRMWRKTRSSDNSFMAQWFGCLGTDPNRNWDYKWGGKGASTQPCSQTYRGPKAASEVEVSQTQDYIYKRREQIKLLITLHAYSQMIFTPWGYDYVPLEDAKDLNRVAKMAADALESVHGTKFEYGASPDLLYPAAGGTEDWGKGVAGIKFSYCYELRDKGKHGFNLPPEQIVPSGQETFASVKAMVEGVMAYYNVEGF